MLPLDRTAEFDPGRIGEFLEQLPDKPGVVLAEPRRDLPNARPLLLRTSDVRRRLNLLLKGDAGTGRRINLQGYLGRIRFRVTGSRFEQALVQWEQARWLWPDAYRRRLRLRAPALIKLTQTSAYPRAYVTRRTGSQGIYFGPFASRRAAERFLEAYLDLYRIRRCQIKIQRDPNFPGCMYSEMKKCLAPCYGGCSEEEYRAEAQRAAEFLESGGESLVNALEQERERASLHLDFEGAAAIHRHLEKAAAAQEGIPGIAGIIGALDAAVLQRGAEEETVAVFGVCRSRIQEPFLLRFSELASQPRPAEEILRNRLEGGAGAGTEGPRGELEDHVALLARWFFAHPREGEIFFPEGKQNQQARWPYRRMLRACARLLNAGRRTGE